MDRLDFLNNRYLQNHLTRGGHRFQWIFATRGAPYMLLALGHHKEIKPQLIEFLESRYYGI